MLKHNPIPNTIYISASGFPVVYAGLAHSATDCSQQQALYTLVVDTFDTVRGTMFYNDLEVFKERFSPISELGEDKRTYRRRVTLMVLGSRFNTFGMLANNAHNEALVVEFMNRKQHPVRITNMVRDADLPRYYEDTECQDAWLENLTLRAYGPNEEWQVLSADLVTDQLNNEYVQQLFPLDEEGRFAVPSRYISSIQVETQENHTEDGRVQLERLHNAFVLI